MGTCGRDLAGFGLGGLLHLHLQGGDGSLGGLEGVVGSYYHVVKVLIPRWPGQSLPTLVQEATQSESNNRFLDSGDTFIQIDLQGRREKSHVGASTNKKYKLLSKTRLTGKMKLGTIFMIVLPDTFLIHSPLLQTHMKEVYVVVSV